MSATLPGPSASTTTSSPSATSNPNSSSPAPQSSSLYLFTFLATLLLLLAVSCAIVIRSFILRRRFRQRIEEAIAAGVLIPGTLDDPSCRRRRDFGETPKLWEVWVDDHEHKHENLDEYDSVRSSLVKSQNKWEGILPVSATVQSSNKPRPIRLPGSESAHSLPTSEFQTAQHPIFRLLGRRLFRHRLLVSTPLPAQSPPQQYDNSESQLGMYPLPETAKDRDLRDEMLQVSVLISMPNPSSRRSYGSDFGGRTSTKGKEKGSGFEDGETEGEIPDVVFGLAEVGLRL